MASTSATLCHSHGAAATVPFTFTEEEQIPSPPPPTPCNHPLSTGETDAFLSHLLTRLSLPPPTLTPVLSLRRKQKNVTPSVISLHEPNRQLFLSAATELGFFHVSDHGIPLHLHETYSENYRSKIIFSGTRDIGCRGSDEAEHVHMFEPDCGDEYARELERVGLKVLEFLFEERGIGIKTKCLMYIFPNKMEKSSMEKVAEEHFQSCIMQLTYEGTGKKVSSAVVDDSGKWVPVEAREDVVLVTLGEVAQVWSDGKFKKVRNFPQPSPPALHQSKEPSNVLVTLLITVPEDDSIVTAPLMPIIEDTKISSEELH